MPEITKERLEELMAELPDDPSEFYGETDSGERDGLGEAGKRALDAERKARRDADKALREAQARLKEFEDADKTEQQRLTESSQSATSRADKAEQELLRLTVGLGKGLTPAQARRLVGSSKEELESDADELLETFGSTKKAEETEDDGSASETEIEETTSRGRPKEKLHGGASAEDEDDGRSPEELADAVMKKARGY